MQDLEHVFSYIISSQELDKSSIDLAQVISENGIQTTRMDCMNVLSADGRNDKNNLRKNSLPLLMFYLKVVLNDNLISEEELRNIRFLKLLFGIEEGDFLKHTDLASETTNIIKSQVDLIYSDDEVSSQQAIHKVNLQEAFGLNYDEFLHLSSKAALESLERTGDWIRIDTFISEKDYHKWRKRNASLNRLENQESSSGNRQISQGVKDDVWNRDGGICVYCGSNENLEFDHIIPFSKGGSNTYRNIQLLCEPCNRSKSDKIG